MPKYLILRVHPTAQLSAADFLSTVLTTHSIEVFLSDGTATGTTVPLSLAQQHLYPIGTEDAAVATLAILTDPSWLSGSTAATVRLKVTGGSSTYVDIGYIGISVFDFATLPTNLSALSPSAIIGIPPTSLSGASLVPSIMLPGGGQPVPYSTLFSEVTTYISNNGLPTLKDLTFAECETIAQGLQLPVSGQTVPPSGSDTLEELFTIPLSNIYTFGSQRAIYLSDRATTISNMRDGQAANLAKFVYGLSVAAACEEETMQRTSAFLRFPTRPAVEMNPAVCREMEVNVVDILTEDETPTGILTIETRFFYAMDPMLGEQVVKEVHCASVFGQFESSIYNELLQGKQNGIIDDDEDTLHLQARVLAALGTAPVNVVNCSYTKPGVEAFITNWSTVVGDEFWDTWDTANDLGHFHLVLCGLLGDLTPVESAAILTNYNSAEELQGQNPAIEDPIPEDELLGLPRSEWEELVGITGLELSLFLITVESYFTVLPDDYEVPEPTSADATYPPAVAAFITCYNEHEDTEVPFNPYGTWDNEIFEAALVCVYPDDEAQREELRVLIEALRGNDPISTFFECFEIDLIEELWDIDWNEKKAADALACVFPGDKCAQEWLKEKMFTLGLLHQLTFSIDCVAEDESNGSFLQLSIMEALYASGFTSIETILSYSEEDFSCTLSGTVAHACAPAIYEQAVSLSNPTTKPTPRDGFYPLNDGSLKNCIPHKLQGVDSIISYLRYLLGLAESSSCDEPFPIPTEEEDSISYLKDTISARRGDVENIQTSLGNACTSIPYLDIVNENLEHLIATNGESGVVHNTGDNILGHQVVHEEEGSIENGHHAAPFLAAQPEHSSPNLSPIGEVAYGKLRSSFADACLLPYHQGVDVQESYLSALGMTRLELLQKWQTSVGTFPFSTEDLAPEDIPAAFPDYLEGLPMSNPLVFNYLGITAVEYDALYNGTLEDSILAQVLGPIDFLAYQDNNTDILQLCNLLRYTGLCFDELQSVFKQKYFLTDLIFEGESITLSSEPCNCEDYQVVFLTLGGAPAANQFQYFKKLLIFTRLSKRLQTASTINYSIDEFARVCYTFQLFNGGATVNPTFVNQLVAFNQLREKYCLAFAIPDQVNLYLTDLWSNDEARRKLVAEYLLHQLCQCEKQQLTQECRPPEEVKIWLTHIPELAELVGFEPAPQPNTWYASPVQTVYFIEQLAKLCRSNFSIREIFFLLGGDEDLSTTHPFPGQTEGEAHSYALNYPDNEAKYSLAALREKLCKIELTEEQIAAFTFSEIEKKLQEVFGYQPTGASDDPLRSFAAHFFPEELINMGYNVTAADQRYRVTVASTPGKWNHAGQDDGFKYLSGDLTCRIPRTDATLIKQLSTMPQLDDDEQKAVRTLYILPLKDLANFCYIFEDFKYAQTFLTHEPDAQKRFAFVQEQFANFYFRAECTVQHLTEHVATLCGSEEPIAQQAAWDILKRTYSSSNKPTDGIWEFDDGTLPNPLPWTNGLGTVLTSLPATLIGTGLLATITPQGSVAPVWRSLSGDMKGFGTAENRMDSPFPTTVPNLALNSSDFTPSPNFATIRNGYAIDNIDRELLGGVEGYKVVWVGQLLVNTFGEYRFFAGAPAGDNAPPDFESAAHAKWEVTLENEKNQQRWTLLHHDDGEGLTGGDCSAPLYLKQGFYCIRICYEQSQPTFNSLEDGCPQTTGFQLSWQGPDTEQEIQVLPKKQLFLKCDALPLSTGLELPTSTDDCLNPLTGLNELNCLKVYLDLQYFGTLEDARSDYQRVFKSLLIATRLGLSGEINPDEGQSELSYLLDHPGDFTGMGYYKTTSWQSHAVGFSSNFLSVGDNYCTSDDDRRDPSLHRRSALFNQLLRLCRYTELRDECGHGLLWPIFKKAHHEALDVTVDLANYLKVDLRWIALATQFEDSGRFDLTQAHFVNELWLHRVCGALRCIEKWVCHFTPKDIRTAEPALWASDDFEQTWGDANSNLTTFIRDGLLENGHPIQYDRLRTLNDGIRERSRNALVQFVVNTNLVLLTATEYIQNTDQLSQFLLVNVEAGLCQRMSRIEELISVFQTYVQRAKLGVEPSFTPSAEFCRLWDKQLQSFSVWSKMIHHLSYPENWIEQEQAIIARKSESYRLLEQKAPQEILTLAHAGGDSMMPGLSWPPTQPLQTIQENLPQRFETIETQGLTHLSVPQSTSESTLLTKVDGQHLPFFIEAARSLKVPFIRIVVAKRPSTKIAYPCKHEGCCKCCHDPAPEPMSIFYFWLGTGKYFKAVETDPNFDGWTDPQLVPELLHINQHNRVTLAWTEQTANGFSPLRWSSEGIMVDGVPELRYIGKEEDILRFQIGNGSSPVGYPDTPEPGFRYNTITDAAIAVPQIGYTESSGVSYFGLTGLPYFLYYQVGQPALPAPKYSTAILVARKLLQACNYEAALKWMEAYYNPLKEDNAFAYLHDPEKRAALMLYVDILLDFGKQMMQVNTVESFQKAQVVFGVAEHILGKCPSDIFEDYSEELVDTISSFSPKMPPVNPRIMLQYQEVADQIQLVNQCLDKQLCHPVRPFASIDNWSEEPCSPCSDIDLWCLPATGRYNFEYYRQRALELVGTATSLGNTLLSVEEKLDSALLSNLQQVQGRQLMQMNLEVSKLQYQAAQRDRQSIEHSIVITAFRRNYLIASTPFGQKTGELDQIDKFGESITELYVAGAADLVGQIAALGPDTYFGVIAFAHTIPSGTKALNVSQMVSSGARTLSSIAGIKGSRSKTLATDERQNEDRAHQIVVLGQELIQLNMQLQAAQRREESNLIQLSNQQLQIEHSLQIEAFLRNKNTSEALYAWMKEELRGILRQTYQCALYYAHLAQREYQICSGYISKRYLTTINWKNSWNGYLVGEQLQLALQHLQKAYEEDSFRGAELTKQVSLRDEYPMAVIQLRHSDNAYVELTEAIFDKDHAGMYKRMVKNITLTLPCVAGPYTNVNCTMKQLGSRIRTKPYLLKGEDCCSPASKTGYAYAKDDDRFVVLPCSEDFIATSKAMDDPGILQVSFQDPQKLPFQDTGVISKWCISIPEANNRFDKKTISDCIIKMIYKALPGGNALMKAANEHYGNYLPGNGKRLIILNEDRPDDWYQFQHDEERKLAVHLGRKDFPYIPGHHSLFVDQIELFIETAPCPPCDSIDIYFQEPEDSDCVDCDDTLIRCVQLKHLGGLFHGVLSHYFEVSNDRLLLGGLKFPEDIVVKRVYLLLGYGEKGQ